MKQLVLLFMLCLALNNKAQNLVPNPSFEIHNDCFYARVDNAIGWNSTNNGQGVSGYLQVCNTDPFFTAPRQYLSNCFQSYQTIRTGNAYAEFVSYPQSSGTQESNHPAVKLIDTLKAGSIYCVTYYVSLFNNSVYTLDQLGALFTPTPFPYMITGTTTPTVAIVGQYTPQVVSTPGIAIGDTLTWTEVSGSFTAGGDEAYLTLGDFFFHNQHYIKNSYPTNCNGLAEYYVDDVSVEVVEIAKAKNDTVIMQGDSVIIGANNSEAALFSWQPSEGLSCTNCPNPKASPTITTTYTVTKTQCKATTTDVITITVSPTGIAEAEALEASLKLVPNPTNGIVNINSRYDFEKVELLSITGQTLLSEPVRSKEHELQLQNFAEGIYFVKIIYSNGQSVTKKIIKN